MKKRVAILGSTGSIGVNALDVISSLADRFEVVALSADSSVKLLAGQAKEFRPRAVSIGDEKLAAKARSLIGRDTKVLFGLDGLNEIVSRSDVDMVLFAVSGSSCLIPLLEAIRHRKQIALANKEALVSAGPLVMSLARKNGVRILPVDSEHSAIFQCIEGKVPALSKIYLTGSGGPLLGVEAKRFDKLPLARVLNHPKWKMGRKISVDSATMMNKGLEIIEAKYLFDIDEKRIDVLIHPEAVIHSMAEFADGSMLAQLASCDMRGPIQYALTYPYRLPGRIGSVDLSKIGRLTFERPDLKKFPCLELAREAAKAAGTAPAVLCASDEEAVRHYLEGKIKLSGIAKTVEKVLKRHKNIAGRELVIYDVLEADRWARQETRSICCH